MALVAKIIAESYTDWGLVSLDNVSGTIGATDFLGGTFLVGGYVAEENIQGLNDCLLPEETGIGGTLPPDADPPFPPIWPYPTGLTYSREHFSMILRAIRGDTNKFDFQVLISGAAVNISAFTFRFTAKYQQDDEDVDAVFTCTNSDGISLTAPTNGELRVTVSPAKTNVLPKHDTDLFWDLQYVDAASEVHTVAMGTLQVRCDVSLTTP